MPDVLLPDGFDELTTFSTWVLRTERERSDRRQASTVEEIGVFYAAMTARIDEIFAHLAGLPPSGLAEPDENLLLLVLSLQEIAIVVENYGAVAVPDGWDIRQTSMTVVGGTY